MFSRNALCLILLCVVIASTGFAQKNDIALSIGAVTSTDQHEFLPLGLACTIQDPNCNHPTFTTDSGIAYEAAFARQLFSPRGISLSLELPVLGAPARDVSNNSFPTGNGVSSIFFTPGVRFSFLPDGRISPFATVGGGLAHFSFGTSKNTGAFEFGGGLDFKLPIQRLSFRVEARDFFSGASIIQSSHQHNVFAGGGLVLHF